MRLRAPPELCPTQAGLFLEVRQEVQPSIRRVSLSGLCEGASSAPGQGRTSELSHLPVITVGGLPGSGKSTFAKLLAEELGLEYLSAGHVFRKMAADMQMDLETFSKYAEGNHEIDRKIDEMQVEMARGKDIVVDSRLSAWVIGEADLKVCLVASRVERSRRIAERDGLDMEQAISRVSEREKSERLRYRDIYDIDVGSLEVYDLIVNSGTYLPHEIVTIARKALEIALEGKKGKAGG